MTIAGIAALFLIRLLRLAVTPISFMRDVLIIKPALESLG